MTQPLLFVLAVLALLATPGPTNTLLAASGALAGFRRSLRLVPAEIAGYLISIGLLMAVAGPLIARHPGLGMALRLGASLWLARCAVRLWQGGGSTIEAATAPISFRRVFITTLLNPKALIFALGIIPPGTAVAVAPWLGLFSGLVLAVALGWIALGRALARSAGGRATPWRVWRIAAAGFLVFAAIVAWRAIAGGL